MQWVLGIDTSNYTTSLAAVDVSGQHVIQARRILPVPAGERGLRQSEALFFHVQRLPLLLDELYAQLLSIDAKVEWLGIGVSSRPRPLGRSYMPVFTVGVQFGLALARSHGIPLLPVSHQENHLAAAEYGLSKGLSPDESAEADFAPSLGPFIGIHVSGGTSDVLVAERTRFGYRIEQVGEGLDLHAGQFVDRVGVAMGLPFPAGPHLERLAEGAEKAFPLPSRVIDGQMSFSGPCSAALRALADGVSAASVAQGVQTCIANSLVKAIAFAYQQHPEVQGVMIAGGVAANRTIRQRVRHRLRIQLPGVPVAVAPPEYARDNAVGTAHLAHRFLLAHS
ncbi:MAG: peptidase M22 [Alicyclobacillus herbarius]|uniref:Kae1-like domain-containing protein n=1 Tax=Alicyclobacillus herbarius TaxID=122960 RepID=UPI0003F90C8C|nr:hypothetical protein [Alicyclobacillus herbarius]MCL6631658.1 peptidase M22 [Alicyclobacillus herbarius]